MLGEVLPAPIDLARFEGLVAIEDDQLFETEPVLRLAALLPDDQVGAVQFAERLRLSNAERDRHRRRARADAGAEELDEPARDPAGDLPPGAAGLPRPRQARLGAGRPHGDDAAVARHDRAGRRLDARRPSR